MEILTMIAFVLTVKMQNSVVCPKRNKVSPTRQNV